MSKLTIEQLTDIENKKILLRVDFNVPINDQKQVTDTTRLKAALPTIRYLLKRKAKVILLSHFGRPKGQPNDKYSLKPVVSVLEELLGQEVSFSPTLLGSVAEVAIANLKPGGCILMENVRFYPQETDNEQQFAKELAALADYYVNDAFGTAHRAHASTEGVTHYFTKSACGFLMKKELEYLLPLATSPEPPFVAIVGGAKVKDKIQLLSKLLDVANALLIGGGMAYSFLHVQGYKIGNSILDADNLHLCEELFAKAKSQNKKIYLPIDHVVATSFSNDVPTQIVEGDIPDGSLGMDIGPKTIALYQQALANVKTVFWNGPMGVFEMSNFQKGTFSIGETLAQSNAKTVVGGGDSVNAINQAGLGDKISHISTGGGASLELLQGNKLPGIEALTEV